MAKEKQSERKPLVKAEPPKAAPRLKPVVKPPAKRETETLVKVEPGPAVEDTSWLDLKGKAQAEAKAAARAKYNAAETLAVEQAKQNPELQKVVDAYCLALKEHRAHCATKKPVGEGPTREALKAARLAMKQASGSPVLGRAAKELMVKDKELFPAR